MNRGVSTKGVGARSEVALLDLEALGRHIFRERLEPGSSVEYSRDAVGIDLEVRVVSQDAVDGPKGAIDVIEPVESLADSEEVYLAEILLLEELRQMLHV